MRRRVRHHVNPLGARFLETGAARITPRGRPVEVELGCADARFLFERAPRHPEVDFIGVEIREPLVEEVNEKAGALGLSNLRAVFANISTELDALFEDASLDRVFINFPDPCFKLRQRPRRRRFSSLSMRSTAPISAACLERRFTCSSPARWVASTLGACDYHMRSTEIRNYLCLRTCLSSQR